MAPWILILCDKHSTREIDVPDTTNIYTSVIDTTELAARLASPEWAIVDCRFNLLDTAAGRRAYREAHIAGAYYAHLEEDLSAPAVPGGARHPLPEPDHLARVFSRWGITADTQLIVYDDCGGAIAARLWWLSRWLGHWRVAVLDGGWGKWLAEARPVSTDAPRAPSSRFAPTVQSDMVVDAATVERIRTLREWRLLDARARERFLGLHEPIDRIAGHIPGAVNLPYTRNVDDNGCLKSTAELQHAFEDVSRGVASDYIVCMCGSGVTACHLLLAMEHAGLRGARLYAGSWSEWIDDGKRPVARGQTA